MRISDWRSDVCSFDLIGMIVWFDVAIFQRPSPNTYRRRVDTVVHHLLSEPVGLPVKAVIVKDALDRSEERRVGKECVSTCRSRWAPSHYKNNAYIKEQVQQRLN